MTGLAIAMWSGPRNISTAMMRAWENRSDTQVIDEPFYAHYLHHTGMDHPMAKEVIAAGQTDWRAVVAQLGSLPAAGILYQKHISTHWLEHYSSDWLSALSHVFLIRHPALVVASYANKRESLNARDLGYEQQARLFDVISHCQGQEPVVIDSDRFLSDPEKQLRRVCDSLNINFQPQMLQWPSGPRSTDGIWAKHWYDAVNRSTGFAPPRLDTPALNEQQQAVVDLCQPFYDRLKRLAL